MCTNDPVFVKASLQALFGTHIFYESALGQIEF